ARARPPSSLRGLAHPCPRGHSSANRRCSPCPRAHSSGSDRVVLRSSALPSFLSPRRSGSAFPQERDAFRRRADRTRGTYLAAGGPTSPAWVRAAVIPPFG